MASTQDSTDDVHPLKYICTYPSACHYVRPGIPVRDILRRDGTVLRYVVIARARVLNSNSDNLYMQWLEKTAQRTLPLSEGIGHIMRS